VKHKPLVVILGGGHGGVRAALDLLRAKCARVILIDRERHHATPAYLYEIATFFRNEKKETKREQELFYKMLLRSVTIPYHLIFEGYREIKIEQGTATRIEPKENKVVMSDGRVVHYEWLIVATGSTTNYFDVPHLKDNSYGLKSIPEAFNIRNKVDELFSSAPKHKTINLVIGGGGPTGVEFAAELVGYAKKLAKLHAHPIGNWHCTIVEQEKTVLSKFSRGVQGRAHRRLSQRGVSVLTESKIVDVWPNVLQLDGKEKAKIPFDLLVWTAGVQGACSSEILYGAHFVKNSCVVVDTALRVAPEANIFTIGDGAASVHPKTGAALPMTAQKAIWEGAYVGRLLMRFIKNPKTKLPPYKPKKVRYVIPVGGKYAIFAGRHLVFGGRIAWLLKYVLLVRYLSSIVSLGYALRYTMRQARIFAKND